MPCGYQSLREERLSISLHSLQCFCVFYWGRCISCVCKQWSCSITLLQHWPHAARRRSRFPLAPGWGCPSPSPGPGVGADVEGKANCSRPPTLPSSSPLGSFTSIFPGVEHFLAPVWLFGRQCWGTGWRISFSNFPGREGAWVLVGGIALYTQKNLTLWKTSHAHPRVRARYKCWTNAPPPNRLPGHGKAKFVQAFIIPKACKSIPSRARSSSL